MSPFKTSAATAGATAVGDRVMPTVNLMPPEIAEAAKFRRFQLAMGAAVAGAVVIVGALYVHGHSGVNSAQQQLDAAKAQQTALQGQLTKLQSVQDVYTRVAQQEAMLQTAMGQEVRWSYFLNDLALKVPDNVWLTKITATEASALAGTTATTPAATSGLGSVTFEGWAFTHDDVATWLDMLSKERGLDQVYFTQSTEKRDESKPNKTYSNFSSTATLTDAAKSGRYAPKAGS